MKKVLFAVFFVLISLTWLPCIAQESPSVALAIRIEPTGAKQPTGRPISLFDASRHFSVILTNVSQAPIRLWQDWCSWGYFNLSFEIADQNGNHVTISRKMKEWEKNFPDWMTIAAGDQMVIDVAFDPAIWRNLPASESGERRTISLRAVYESAKGRDAQEHRVWTGKIASPQDTYLLLR
jgi:hypothetical protein